MFTRPLFLVFQGVVFERKVCLPLIEQLSRQPEDVADVEFLERATEPKRLQAARPR